MARGALRSKAMTAHRIIFLSPYLSPDTHEIGPARYMVGDRVVMRGANFIVAQREHCEPGHAPLPTIHLYLKTPRDLAVDEARLAVVRSARALRDVQKRSHDSWGIPVAGDAAAREVIACEQMLDTHLRNLDAALDAACLPG